MIPASSARRGDRRRAGDRSSWSIPHSLFGPGDTLAAKLVDEFTGYQTFLQLVALLPAAILL
jgi:hypothetical protein